MSALVVNSKISDKLNGKTILISGASFGIGEALSRHLLEYPVHLILTARTSEKLQKLKDESLSSAATVTIYPCDFYSEENIVALCDKLKAHKIDYFVSNAGKSMMRSIEQSANRSHDYKRTIAVNYLAPVQIISTLLGKFKESQTHIVNVSTYNVLMKTPPKWSAYVSSKKAMHSWLESSKTEFDLLNITVSTVYFPLVESRMKEANPTYQNTNAMTMDHAVTIILRALSRRSYNYKPWWNVPVQIALFFVYPLWNIYWRRQLRKKRY